MPNPIVVVDSDERRCQELCTALEREDYRTRALYSLLDLEDEIQGGGCRVAILDLDTLSVDNRAIKNLKKRNPSLCILGLSSRPFHPELKESMSSHIHACLCKPVDEEELVFWVKSLCEG